MNKYYPPEIWSLPPDARRRAQSFIDEGNYYGWRLKAVATRPIGDLLQCTLDFDSTRIVFLAQPEGYRPPTARQVLGQVS